MRIILLVIIILLAGCSKAVIVEEDQEVTLKVLFKDRETFMELYGQYYQSKQPHVKFDVIETDSIPFHQRSASALQSLIEERKPDILVLDAESFSKLAMEGQLYDLTPFTKELEAETFAPGFMDYLISLGGGNVYGLAPAFDSQVIYYNKDLFDRERVAYPSDQMSWEEVVHLAQRFKGEVYGFRYLQGVSPYYLAMSMAKAYDLDLIDARSGIMTADTPQWNKLLNLLQQAAAAGSLDQGGQEGSEEDRFMAGQVAMTMNGAHYRNELMRNDVSFQWDIATAPVNPANREASAYVTVNQLFAIYSGTAHLQASWELIRFIHGDDYAGIIARGSSTSQLPSRLGMVRDSEDRNIDAYYRLRPILGRHEEFMSLPEEMRHFLANVVPDQIDSIFSEGKSVGEVLQAIQEQGEKAWNKEG